MLLQKFVVCQTCLIKVFSFHFFFFFWEKKYWSLSITLNEQRRVGLWRWRRWHPATFIMQMRCEPRIESKMRKEKKWSLMMNFAYANHADEMRTQTNLRDFISYSHGVHAVFLCTKTIFRAILRKIWFLMECQLIRSCIYTHISISDMSKCWNGFRIMNSTSEMGNWICLFAARSLIDIRYIHIHIISCNIVIIYI